MATRDPGLARRIETELRFDEPTRPAAGVAPFDELFEQALEAAQTGRLGVIPGKVGQFAMNVQTDSDRLELDAHFAATPRIWRTATQAADALAREYGNNIGASEFYDSEQAFTAKALNLFAGGGRFAVRGFSRAHVDTGQEPEPHALAQYDQYQVHQQLWVPISDAGGRLPLYERLAGEQVDPRRRALLYMVHDWAILPNLEIPPLTPEA